MTDADVKAISIVLDHITKTIVAEAQKILREIEKLQNKKQRGPKRADSSIKLQRAYKRNAELRRENRELHKLLEKELK